MMVFGIPWNFLLGDASSDIFFSNGFETGSAAKVSCFFFSHITFIPTENPWHSIYLIMYTKLMEQYTVVDMLNNSS